MPKSAPSVPNKECIICHVLLLVLNSLKVYMNDTSNSREEQTGDMEFILF